MSYLYHTLASVLTFILLAQYLWKQRTTASQKTPFPKGPKPLPYLGNLHQVAIPKNFLAFTEWSHSPETSTPDGLVGLRLGPNARAVVLNKWAHVRDLLDSRGKGALYSDRPSLAIPSDVIHGPGTDAHVVFARYGAKWRRARKTIVEFLTDREVAKLATVQHAESVQMMWEFLNFGGDREGRTRYHDSVSRYFGGVILASAFGVRSKDTSARSMAMRFFSVEEEWAAILGQEQTPPVDIFPWLRYVPDFLTPWKGWKERVVRLSERQSGLYRELFSKTEARLRAGKSEECFMARLIMDQEAAVKSGRTKDVYTQVELDYIGGLLLEAGADTTASAFETFILAMSAVPEIQKRAQEEVDSVFGTEEMPHMADGQKLPFLKACFLEVLRWRPPLPTAVPHANTADDIYQGYSIPKGTTLFINSWAISRDPDEFDNPDSFDPSRFLQNPFGVKSKPENDHAPEDEKKNGTALGTVTGDSSEVSSSGRRQVYAFGAGRRVCPGQKMAEQSSLMTMSKLMWCFDVVPGSDEKQDVNISTGWRDGILTGPKVFPVKFVLRDEKKRRIVEQEWEKADQFLSRFE